MASIFSVFLLLSVLCVAGEAQQKQSHQINLGSSLYPTTNPSSWPSPSGQFAFGFYPQGSGYAVGIWLAGKQNMTVVWTANRDDPPVTSNAILDLTKDGKLLLRTEQGLEKLIANNAIVSASFASMLDSGNFVLCNKDYDVIWESFGYPTDTILGGQKLSSGDQLLSSSSETNHSSGRFHLKMQDDGNLVLYPVNTGDSPTDAYWNSGTFGNGFKFHLYLNYTGLLQIINTTNSDVIDTLSDGTSSGNNDDNNNNTIYGATLGVDGVFRLYSYAYDGSGEPKVSTVWSALKNPCEVKSYCGFNSFCTFSDYQPHCLCLPGSNLVDPNQSTLGCEKNYSEAGCRGGKENEVHYKIASMENMLWGDHPYINEPMLIDECNKSCLEDCNCGAALFMDGSCMKQKLPLRYVRRDLQTTYTAFIKVGMRSIIGRNETTATSLKPHVVVIRSKKTVMWILLVTFGFTTFSCVSLMIFGLFIYKYRALRYKRLAVVESLDLTEELTLRLFSYHHLRIATNGFKEELGKGSFGAVYKGALYKGKKLVAVKRLEKLVEEGEKEFRTEMRAIGRTHHRNLVRLLGYCAENSKRLLVYEYMSNGSLADLLFKAERRPDWKERARIALDVARGILYLHEECDSPIIHCDIKPQNILMDDIWTAKISDFGLAKLLMPDQTRTFTEIRGTRGYLAPEWQKNAPISVKADIYSYGIVLLEIVCCRKNLDIQVSRAEEIILSTWVYKCFVARELDRLVIGEEVDKKTLEKMVMVGLWCIQDEPALRPSMKSVVLMLEGITDVSVPPCPTTISM